MRKRRHNAEGKPCIFDHLKLLVVSHSCATPLNQQIYAEIRRQTGWDITLLVPDNWRDEFGNTLETTLWNGCDLDLRRVPVWNNGNIILHWYRHQWGRFLDRERFDAIYVNHEPYAIATGQVAWANARGAKVPMGFYSCQNLIKRYPLPFRWLEQMVHRNSSFAFPITDAVAGILRHKGFLGDMAVCPLPLDPSIYFPYPKEAHPAAMMRNEETVMLGFAGRVIEAKGLRTLALALCQLLDLDWKFTVIGTGPFVAEFKAILDRGGVLPRLIQAGFVAHEETPKYLAALDILVLPSETQRNWKEQFGRVIPEALACGAAVIGSDSGEIPNLIRVSEGGLVFPERDAGALGNALRELIVDREKRKCMAECGRRWVTGYISLQPVAASMVATVQRSVRKN